MPQLDILITTSQGAFMLLFWLGYVIFLRTLLVLLSIVMKFQHGLIHQYAVWFRNNLLHTSFRQHSYISLLESANTIVYLLYPFTTSRSIFFGTYSSDLKIIVDKVQNDKH